MTASTSATPRAENTISTALTTSSVLWELWERAAPSMSHSDMQWFTGASEHAQFIARNASTVVEGLGCLISSDDNCSSLQDRDTLPDLLFSISQQFDVITGMLNISGAAQDMIDRSKPR